MGVEKTLQLVSKRRARRVACFRRIGRRVNAEEPSSIDRLVTDLASGEFGPKCDHIIDDLTKAVMIRHGTRQEAAGGWPFAG